jgi:hypothetical protein
MQSGVKIVRRPDGLPSEPPRKALADMDFVSNSTVRSWAEAEVQGDGCAKLVHGLIAA